MCLGGGSGSGIGAICSRMAEKPGSGSKMGAWCSWVREEGGEREGGRATGGGSVVGGDGLEAVAVVGLAGFVEDGAEADGLAVRLDLFEAGGAAVRFQVVQLRDPEAPGRFLRVLGHRERRQDGISRDN